MNKNWITFVAAMAFAVCLLTGCGGKQQDTDPVETQPSDVETTTLHIPNETLPQGLGNPPWETTQPQTTEDDRPILPADTTEFVTKGEESKPTVPVTEETKPSVQETRPEEQPPETVETVPADKTQQTEPTEPVRISYEEFIQMDNFQQQAYYETFSDMQSYLDWFNSAVEEYEKEHPPINADGGGIDLDEIIGGK